MPSTRSTEGFSSTTSSICAHRWLFTSETVIVFHHAYLYLGTEISFSEGTTQEDPLAMPIYAIGITPLLEILKPETSDVTTLKHMAFADDLGGAGDLLELRRWWDNIVNCGPKL